MYQHKFPAGSYFLKVQKEAGAQSGQQLEPQQRRRLIRIEVQIFADQKVTSTVEIGIGANESDFNFVPDGIVLVPGHAATRPVAIGRLNRCVYVGLKDPILRDGTRVLGCVFI